MQPVKDPGSSDNKMAAAVDVVGAAAVVELGAEDNRRHRRMALSRRTRAMSSVSNVMAMGTMQTGVQGRRKKRRKHTMPR